MNVGIINVTGYAGAELVRLLHRHEHVSVVSVTGRSTVGKRLQEVFPHLANVDMVIEPELSASVDIVFSALPHKASAEAIIPLLKDGIRVIDISADFRLKSTLEYEKWYGTSHPSPEFLDEAVYGLTELNRKKVEAARLVANPGCYPTSVILGLAPAVKSGLIQPDIVVDSKSGVSGAGRELSLATHFSEVNENVKAYQVDGHRHLPEMTQELDILSSDSLNIIFIPHLVPLTRGILSSCYTRLRMGEFSSPKKAKDEIVQIYRDFYKDEPFIKVVDVPPQTKQTLGTNMCLVYPTVDDRTNRLIVISCLDNLVKGAAGQAIQNMNAMCHIPETVGLENLAIYP